MRARGRIAIVLVAACLGAGAETATASFPVAADGRIVFERDDRLFLAGADGSGAVELTFGAAPGVEQETPSFSPDGRFLAFSRDLGAGNEAIFVGELATGQATQVTFPSNARLHGDPSFSPDGKRIAFSGDVVDGGVVDLRIFVMNRNGSGLLQLTDGDDAFDYTPSFSPDGERIVFTRGGSVNDVFVMPAAGGAPVNVTNTANGAYYGSFSPDGSKILFLHDPYPAVPSPSRLSTIPSTGGPITDITPDGGYEFPPAFSPSGSRLLFIEDTNPAPPTAYDLMTMPAGGGPGVNLTPGSAGSEQDSDWEAVYRCAGRRATIVGDDGPEKIKGTKRADVIVANGGNDKVSGRGGRDRICGGRGKDKLRGGAGRDVLKGGQGKDSERQ